MCKRCDFINALVDLAGDYEMTPNDLMEALASLMITGSAALSKAEETNVTVLSYDANTGKFISVIGANPWMDDKAMHCFTEQMEHHNSKKEEHMAASKSRTQEEYDENVARIYEDETTIH